MTTYDQIEDLNYNDLSFLTGKSVADCKWEIAEKVYTVKDMDNEENFTKTGVPKIKITDTIKLSEFDKACKSCTELEGELQFKHIVETYNKGVGLDRLLKYSENKAFIKGIKFTGNNSILNGILNKEQLLKLQKAWVVKNYKYHCVVISGSRVPSDTLLNFIKHNKWAKTYLKEQGIIIEGVEDIEVIEEEEVKHKD